MKKGILKSTRSKVIAFVVVILIIGLAIGGYLLYRNLTMQKEERASLISEIHKNHPTEENADYLQRLRFLDIERWDDLKDIDQKADNEKIKLDDVKKLRKQQEGILDPITDKLSDKDADLTKSIKEKLTLLDNSGIKVTDAIINLKQIKSTGIENFDLEKTVNENVPQIKRKADALAQIQKVAYDKKALLAGDFSSIVGTYINIAGKELMINKQGGNDDSCQKGAKAKFNDTTKVYTWQVTCKQGRLNGVFIPIGVKTQVMIGGHLVTIPSNTNKNRVILAPQIQNSTNYVYQRK